MSGVSSSKLIPCKLWRGFQPFSLSLSHASNTTCHARSTQASPYIERWRIHRVMLTMAWDVDNDRHSCRRAIWHRWVTTLFIRCCWEQIRLTYSHLKLLCARSSVTTTSQQVAPLAICHNDSSVNTTRDDAEYPTTNLLTTMASANYFQQTSPRGSILDGWKGRRHRCRWTSGRAILVSSPCKGSLRLV